LVPLAAVLTAISRALAPPSAQARRPGRRVRAHKRTAAADVIAGLTSSSTSNEILTG